MGFAGYVPCPDCFGVGGHKMSCRHASAVVGIPYGDSMNYKDKRMSGQVAQLAHLGYQASYFDVPLVSHVEGNLYQGGCKQGVELHDDDDTWAGVVSLYPWEQYKLDEDTERVEIKMYDGTDGVDWDDLDRASDKVLEYMEKGRTLVHCQAGLNRSGLVAAVTLMKMGYSAQEAIDKLRRGRSDKVLCNKKFLSQLHELQHKMEANDESAKVSS